MVAGGEWTKTDTKDATIISLTTRLYKLEGGGLFTWNSPSSRR